MITDDGTPIVFSTNIQEFFSAFGQYLTFNIAKSEQQLRSSFSSPSPASSSSCACVAVAVVTLVYSIITDYHTDYKHKLQYRYRCYHFLENWVCIYPIS